MQAINESVSFWRQPKRVLQFTNSFSVADRAPRSMIAGRAEHIEVARRDWACPI
jgi:hypothetical protein